MFRKNFEAWNKLPGETVNPWKFFKEKLGKHVMWPTVWFAVLFWNQLKVDKWNLLALRLLTVLSHFRSSSVLPPGTFVKELFAQTANPNQQSCLSTFLASSLCKMLLGAFSKRKGQKCMIMFCMPVGMWMFSGRSLAVLYPSGPINEDRMSVIMLFFLVLRLLPFSSMGKYTHSIQLSSLVCLLGIFILNPCEKAPALPFIYWDMVVHGLSTD